MKKLYHLYLYRHWQRLLHKFHLHHTKIYGPMEDGYCLEKCDWCGINGLIWPKDSVPRLLHPKIESENRGVGECQDSKTDQLRAAMLPLPIETFLRQAKGRITRTQR